MANIIEVAKAKAYSSQDYSFLATDDVNGKIKLMDHDGEQAKYAIAKDEDGNYATGNYDGKDYKAPTDKVEIKENANLDVNVNAYRVVGRAEMAIVLSGTAAQYGSLEGANTLTSAFKIKKAAEAEHKINKAEFTTVDGKPLWWGSKCTLADPDENDPAIAGHYLYQTAEGQKSTSPDAEAEVTFTEGRDKVGELVLPFHLSGVVTDYPLTLEVADAVLCSDFSTLVGLPNDDVEELFGIVKDDEIIDSETKTLGNSSSTREVTDSDKAKTANGFYDFSNKSEILKEYKRKAAEDGFTWKYGEPHTITPIWKTGNATITVQQYDTTDISVKITSKDQYSSCGRVQLGGISYIAAEKIGNVSKNAEIKTGVGSVPTMNYETAIKLKLDADTVGKNWTLHGNADIDSGEELTGCILLSEKPASASAQSTAYDYTYVTDNYSTILPISKKGTKPTKDSSLTADFCIQRKPIDVKLSFNYTGFDDDSAYLSGDTYTNSFVAVLERAKYNTDTFESLLSSHMDNGTTTQAFKCHALEKLKLTFTVPSKVAGQDEPAPKRAVFTINGVDVTSEASGEEDRVSKLKTEPYVLDLSNADIQSAMKDGVLEIKVTVVGHKAVLVKYNIDEAAAEKITD